LALVNADSGDPKNTVDVGVTEASQSFINVRWDRQVPRDALTGDNGRVLVLRWGLVFNVDRSRVIWGAPDVGQGLVKTVACFRRTKDIQNLTSY
jgi:hypothetical protein